MLEHVHMLVLPDGADRRGSLSRSPVLPVSLIGDGTGAAVGGLMAGWGMTLTPGAGRIDAGGCGGHVARQSFTAVLSGYLTPSIV